MFQVVVQQGQSTGDEHVYFAKEEPKFTGFVTDEGITFRFVEFVPMNGYPSTLGNPMKVPFDRVLSVTSRRRTEDDE